MIMIVDDNAAMRAIMKQYIQSIKVNHEFYECGDGFEAVDAFRRLHPDWVLMDIKMPTMDGLTATKTIRQQFPSARVIIVTNFDDPELRDAAQKSGATGYVLKERLFELQGLMA
ncbi:MAG: response regulator transcription factor [Ignavibacteria bacterium]|nr:response regulator transcription factor [Ignavibacteria bacterium]MBI3764893.1 response regulator transcription factor [Ignavibacteriales bacterium]